MAQQSHDWAYNLRKSLFKKTLVPQFHCNTIYNSQDVEATQVSISRWMDKEYVVHICNRILLSHKKEQIWINSNEVDEIWVYYIEWSKKEKNKYLILIHVHEIRKIALIKLFVGKEWGCRCREWTCGHSGRRRG